MERRRDGMPISSIQCRFEPCLHFQQRVAQFGRVLAWGASGRRFKSCHADMSIQYNNNYPMTGNIVYYSGGTTSTTGWTGSGVTFKPRRSWWYKMYIRECPLCHRKDIMREKQDYPRPENREDRVLHEFVYDYCG